MITSDEKSDSTAGELGQLHVAVRTKSMFLNERVPVEVRDSSYGLIECTDENRSFNLAPGLYQVSAVLGDGQQHRRIINVGSGARVDVEFDAEYGRWDDAFSEHDSGPSVYVISSEEGTLTRPAMQWKHFMRLPVGEDVGTSPIEQASLELHGAKTVSQSAIAWRVVADGSITAIPYAVISFEGARYEISLPIHPGLPGYEDDDASDPSCDLTLERSPTGWQARAHISEERTVASALETMLLSRELTSVSSVANSAAELLWDKYRDPTGATLGAIILNKFGSLEIHKTWLENLSRNFAWIPDSSVLLAALLLQDGEDSLEKDRAFELLVHASEQRPLFSKSFALLLDLWRRWPKKHLKQSSKVASARESAILRLGTQSPFVDWNSLYLCYVTRQDE